MVVKNFLKENAEVDVGVQMYSTKRPVTYHFLDSLLRSEFKVKFFLLCLFFSGVNLHQ